MKQGSKGTFHPSALATSLDRVVGFVVRHVESTSLHLCAIDLDGTLLSSDKSVSRANRNAVRRLRDRGVGIVFVTGRPARCLDVLDGLAGIQASTITCNGAAIWDHDQESQSEVRSLDACHAASFVARVRRLIPNARFAVEFGDHFGFEPDYATWPSADTTGDSFEGPIAELVAEGRVLKLLISAPGHDTEDLFANVQAMAGRGFTVAHSTPNPIGGPVEITAAGVNKGTALRSYCVRHGIDQSATWAFGDMPNDLPMLRWAARGFIMPQAHISLQKEPNLLQMTGAQESAVGRVLLGI